MMMTTAVRKIALTAHISSSVGWLGALGAFLALAVAGLTMDDALRVRSAYLAMELTTWYVIVPLSLAAFATGVIQSLGTSWGLFRHYWVVAKLAVTVVATLILLVHTQPIGAVADAAAAGRLAPGDLQDIRIQLIADAVAAIVALLIATSLSIYKPLGMTPYGIARMDIDDRPLPRWVRYAWWLVAGVIGLFVLLHLAGGGMHGH
jgi:hypothetical protein